jgi:CheY-like chemotaxis protein
VTRRVVLCEDENDIRELVVICLEFAGWDVTAVPTGADCVMAVRDHAPDAVLLDVMMPGQDGPATLAQLRADPATAEVPVVFLTAKHRAREVEQLVELGAVGVIGKPFDPLGLAREVSALLRWS